MRLRHGAERMILRRWMFVGHPVQPTTGARLSTGVSAHTMRLEVSMKINSNTTQAAKRPYNLSLNERTVDPKSPVRTICRRPWITFLPSSSPENS